MNTEAALLRAVCDHPEDDLPRKAIADWWEENGQEDRAELVRVQLELADLACMFHDVGTHDKCPRCANFRLLSGREDELLLRLALENWRWLVSSVHWRRGFGDEVHCIADDWLTQGRKIVREQPITKLVLIDCEPNDYGPPEDSCRFGWLVRGAAGHTGPACLPRVFVEAVTRLRHIPARWPTAADAKADLSIALLTWAREGDDN